MTHPNEISVEEAARILDVSKGSATKLLSTGLLGGAPAPGGRRMASADTVRELQQRPEVAPGAPAAFVVRLGEPKYTSDGWRQGAGWATAWSPSAQADGVRGDWIIEPGPVLEAGVLVAVVGNFVVAAYAVTGLETQYLDEVSGRRRSRFLIAGDDDVTAPFLGHRWTLRPGWTTAVIGAGG